MSRLIWRALPAAAGLVACVAADAGSVRPAPAMSPLTPSFGCTQVPTLDPNDVNFLTGDIVSLSVQQPDVDCFAWQTFMALNWPVDAAWPGNPASAGMPDRTQAAATWGSPQDPLRTQLRPTTWQSFKSTHDIFVPPGTRPSGWGVPSAPPSQCGSAPALAPAVQPTRVLRAISKVVAPRERARMHLDSARAQGAQLPPNLLEAAGGWLTDQAGNLVWYEIAVDRSEFEYLMAPDGRAADALYAAAGQDAVASNADGTHPNGLVMPAGTAPSGTTVQPWRALGAIEVKAAWRNLTGQPNLWPRYLLSQAWTIDPITGDCSQAVLGLVGLHIIHSTGVFPDFVWATFEHVDNAPQPTAPYPDPYSHPDGWSFNNPNCTTNCTPNQRRIDRNGNPLFPYSEPVQVTRESPIPTEVARLNLAMQQAIAKANPQSVFQYYQLVNVLWDNSPPTPVTGPNQGVPLATSGFTSAGPNTPVANTTLETYVQTLNCTACHRSAPISRKPLASDFSFIFLGTKQ